MCCCLHDPRLAVLTQYRACDRQTDTHTHTHTHTHDHCIYRAVKTNEIAALRKHKCFRLRWVVRIGPQAGIARRRILWRLCAAQRLVNQSLTRTTRHNVFIMPWRAVTDDRPSRKFRRVWTYAVFEMCERTNRQTDRQTNMSAYRRTLIAISCTDAGRRRVITGDLHLVFRPLL